MRIALDASYSIGTGLTGVGVYSRELLNGLAASGFADRWDWFYRSQRFLRALRQPVPHNVTRKLLSDSWGSRSASLFHGLNQRLPAKRFRKQIATFHDLFVLTGDYSTAEFRARFAQQARDAAARADLIIAVSAFTASQVETLLKVTRDRIRVVHHGVVPRTLPDLPREKIVLCVGAIQKRKNQAMLVRAFEAMPSDWQLVLAGSNGYGAEQVVAESKSRVHITGFVSDAELAGWYARASIFAFPSLDEGFGMPVLEAMAAGIPVITSNASATREVAGDAAMLIDPRDQEQLAAALVELAQNEKRRDQIAAPGKNHSAQFTWHKAVNQTIDVYRELI